MYAQFYWHHVMGCPSLGTPYILRYVPHTARLNLSLQHSMQKGINLLE